MEITKNKEGSTGLKKELLQKDLCWKSEKCSGAEQTSKLLTSSDCKNLDIPVPETLPITVEQLFYHKAVDYFDITIKI